MHQALKEQFPRNEGYTSHYYAFKFNENDASRLCIKVIVPEEQHQCVIALDPSTAEV